MNAGPATPGAADLLAELGRGVGHRVRDLEAALDRIAAVPSGAGPPAAGPPAAGALSTMAGLPTGPGSAAAGARDLVLAALRELADPVGFALLALLAGGPAEPAWLAQRLGCSRAGVWETAGRLLGVGLLASEEHRVRLTGAGQAVVPLVETLVAAATSGAAAPPERFGGLP